MNVMKCKIFLRCIIAFVFHFYGLTTCSLWFLTFLPVSVCSPTLYWWLVDSLVEFMVTAINCWTWAGGYDIVQVGDDLSHCENDRTLVLVNHQSKVDILMLFSTFNARPRLFAKVMWVMNDIFKYTSFGLVSLIRKDFFILTGKESRDLGLVKLREHLKTWYIPLEKKLLVVFPEGGFLYRRLSRSQSYALKYNLPILHNVSLPRLGAVQTVLGYFGQKTLDYSGVSEHSQLKWVLDVTIAYADGKPLYILDVITGRRKPCRITVFYRLFPFDQVPTDPDAVATWLYSRWQEKDKILSHFYNTGEIPVSDYCLNPLPPRPVIHSLYKCTILNILFIISFYVHCQILYFILCSFL